MSEVTTGELFGRAWKVVLGIPGVASFKDAVDLSSLDIEFRATRNLKPEPNTVELTIFNASEATRNIFGDAAKNTLLLQAGYKSTGVSTIFQGEVRSAVSRHDGVNWETVVRAGDGEKKIKARIALTFGPQVSTGDAIRQIAKKMGIKPGNLDRAVQGLKLKGVADIYPQGGALVGNAWRELQSVARSAGLEVSIQDGALQLLELNSPSSDKAILISKDSGMIASPEVNADGRVTVNTLMLPGLKPGVKVDLRSSTVSGGFRVEECEYSGQSRGEDWGIRATLRRY